MAPATAMLSSMPWMAAAPFSAPMPNHSTNMMASATAEPASRATCGVLRRGCVIDMKLR